MRADRAVKRQYEYLAYPSSPPGTRLIRPHELFHYALATPYYLAYKQVWREGSCRILDAGCGTGLSTLALASANPNARVLGVDFSVSALRAGEERAVHHGVQNVEFKEMALEDIDALGDEFDYVNCEEVLYMVERPRMVLSKLAQLLTKRGIIRFNCHHSGAREPMLRAQQIFRMMGLMADNPEEAEAEWVCNFMEALKPSAELKQRAWDASYRTGADRTTVLLNHLMVRDKGWTVEELFGMIEEEGLQFVSMVNWPLWELEKLFERDTLPDWLEPVVAKLTKKEQLSLKSLIDPRHRLLDVWCCRGHDTLSTVRSAVGDDKEIHVHLHPVLRRDQQFQELCRRSVLEHKVLDITFVEPIHIDPLLSAILLALFEEPKSLETLTTLGEVSEMHRRATEIGQTNGARTWLRMIIERLASPLYLLIEDARHKPPAREDLRTY